MWIMNANVHVNSGISNANVHVLGEVDILILNIHGNGGIYVQCKCTCEWRETYNDIQCTCTYM